MKRNINPRLFFYAVLVITLVLSAGCNKNNSLILKESSPSSSKKDANQNDSILDKSITQSIELEQVSNRYIKELIADKDEKFKNGVYGCIDKSENSYYIFINGVDYRYSNISFSINNKIMTIKYNTKYEKGLRMKDISLIKLNNVDSFDKVQLIDNGKKQDFHILFE